MTHRHDHQPMRARSSTGASTPTRAIRCRSPIRAPAQVFAEVPAGTERDVDAAVDAAGTRVRRVVRARRSASAARSSATRPHHVEQHVDELVPLLTREQGKTLRDSRIEITKAIDTLMHYVGPVEGAAGRAHAEPRSRRRRDRAAPAARRGRRDRAVELPDDAARPTSSRRRWWPGNTVVAKPAGTTPLTTLRFAELLAEGGLPPGVFNVVTGSGSRTGTALVEAPAACARSPSPARRRSASRSWRWPPVAPSA